MSTTDWSRLIELRERRLQQAQETVARDRRAMHRAAARVQDALQAHDAGVAFRHAQAQALVADVAAGRHAVAHLRGAGAYARLLDARVAQAAAAVLAAQAGHAACAQAVHGSLRVLHGAAAELHAAREMRGRVHKARTHGQERRAEDRLEDVARERWLHGRPRADAPAAA